MRAPAFVLASLAAALAATALPAAQAPAPLALTAARVTIEGTSNIHAYTASTTEVTLRALELAGPPVGDPLDHVLQPGVLRAFEVAIPAASLASPKDGIDKNMHKALKVDAHPAIVFRLAALEPADAGYRATGALTIAGVEKDVVLALQAAREGTTLAVTGTTTLRMTDFGVTPPKAMLGLLKTDPEVTIRIDVQFAASPGASR